LQCCCVSNADYGGNDNDGEAWLRRKREGSFYDYFTCEDDDTERCQKECRALNGGDGDDGEYNYYTDSSNTTKIIDFFLSYNIIHFHCT